MSGWGENGISCVPRLSSALWSPYLLPGCYCKFTSLDTFSLSSQYYSMIILKRWLFWRVFSVFFWRCQSSSSVFLFVFFLLYIFCFLKFFYGFGFVFWASLVAQTANSTQCRRPGFDPWVRRIPWRREWLPTPGYLPGEFLEQRILAGYNLWGHKELDMTD